MIRLLSLILMLSLSACLGKDSSSDSGTVGSGSGPAGDAGTGGEGEAPGVFVAIPAGSFDMGCTPAQEATGDCHVGETVHTVTLTRGFYMGETEVTQGEFESLMGYNPSEDDTCGSNCPVENLTWHESAAYANALSSFVGSDSCYTCSGSRWSLFCSPVSESDSYSCEGYRLPTEAEWEYAARAGTDLVYAGSDDASEVAWTYHTSGLRIRPVGSLSPNGWGLYDMSGNVTEVTGDWSSYLSSDDTTDPEADPGSGDDHYGIYRMVRGGSWWLNATTARVSDRTSQSPDDASYLMGFRLVRTIP